MMAFVLNGGVVSFGTQSGTLLLLVCLTQLTQH